MATNKPFSALPWQVPAWRDKSLVMLMDGPAGTGKSHLAAHKVDAYLRKYPGATGLMIRKTRESMTNSTLLFYDRVVVGDDKHVKLKQHSKRFEYANGSVLAYGGMKDHNQREAIRSIGVEGGLDIVWMEEAHLFTLADFEELLPRMRGRAAPWRQIILTTNPDTDMHWIYKRLIQSGEASRHVARTVDNTYNPEDYVDLVLGRLTGVRKQRMLHGRWIGAEGAVYDEFRYEVHVIEPFEIPAEWRRFLSIDFGYRNAFVCQFWAIDPDNRLYLYREIYYTGRLVEDHARQINALIANETIEYIVADHDAEDRATLARYGLHTIAAKKDVAVGVQAVQARIRVDETGKPALFFFHGATVETDQSLIDAKKPACTLDEITGYVWEQIKEGATVKEHPAKVDDHGMDAMRYAVMSVDRGMDIPEEIKVIHF